MFAIGVTGGIGSGKSEVCAILRNLGVVVLSADKLARDIMKEDESIKKKIAKLIGPSAYNKNGGLNRFKIAEVIFSDDSKRKKINEIVHPVVLKEIQKLMLVQSALQKTPLFVIEAALVYESGLDKMLDYVIVVDAQLKERIKRVVARDSTTPEEVRQRIKSQLSAVEKDRRADFIIHNDGDKDLLYKNVVGIYKILMRIKSE